MSGNDDSNKNKVGPVSGSPPPSTADRASRISQINAYLDSLPSAPTGKRDQVPASIAVSTPASGTSTAFLDPVAQAFALHPQNNQRLEISNTLAIAGLQKNIFGPANEPDAKERPVDGPIFKVIPFGELLSAEGMDKAKAVIEVAKSAVETEHGTLVNVSFKDPEQGEGRVRTLLIEKNGSVRVEARNPDEMKRLFQQIPSLLPTAARPGTGFAPPPSWGVKRASGSTTDFVLSVGSQKIQLNNFGQAESASIDVGRYTSRFEDANTFVPLAAEWRTFQGA
jgi:hypothetical protein